MTNEPSHASPKPLPGGIYERLAAHRLRFLPSDLAHVQSELERLHDDLTELADVADQAGRDRLHDAIQGEVLTHLNVAIDNLYGIVKTEEKGRP